MGQILIHNCTDPLMWYKNCIGDTFNMLRVEDDNFLVRDNKGFINIVKLKDAILLHKSN